MKNVIAYLFSVALLSAFTSCFGGMPTTMESFWFGFGVCSVFWGGMLAPVLPK